MWLAVSIDFVEILHRAHLQEYLLINKSLKYPCPTRAFVTVSCSVLDKLAIFAFNDWTDLRTRFLFIDRNPEWQLAGIYADDGISGTNTKKREEFNRMIEDCMASKIEIKTAELIQFDFPGVALL